MHGNLLRIFYWYLHEYFYSPPQQKLSNLIQNISNLTDFLVVKKFSVSSRVSWVFLEDLFVEQQKSPKSVKSHGNSPLSDSLWSNTQILGLIVRDAIKIPSIITSYWISERQSFLTRQIFCGVNLGWNMYWLQFWGFSGDGRVCGGSFSF